MSTAHPISGRRQASVGSQSVSSVKGGGESKVLAAIEQRLFLVRVGCRDRIQAGCCPNTFLLRTFHPLLPACCCDYLICFRRLPVKEYETGLLPPCPVSLTPCRVSPNPPQRGTEVPSAGARSFPLIHLALAMHFLRTIQHSKYGLGWILRGKQPNAI